MPSTYTSRNRAEKQATGEGLNVWGQNLNQRTTDLFDEALDGVESVNLGAAATFDLSDAAYTKNGESDTSRQRILIFSNAHASGTAITIPSVEKWYFIRNSASQAITLAPSGGTTASVPAGADAIVFSNGTNCYAFRARLNELAAPNGAVSMNSQRLTNVADATDPADAVNKAQVEALTDADVQLAEDWATKTNGFVDGSENSAKSWAVGGTGDGDPAAGSAKEWATSTATVDGGLKGARGYAQDASSSAGSASSSAGTAGTAATNAGNSATLAQNWATSTTVVSGGFKGARGYAEDAAASKEAFDDIWVTSASEPGSPVAGMVWFDTSGNVLKVRDATNTVWQTVTGINAASESTAGVIEIATQPEVDAGSDDQRAVTSLKLETRISPIRTKFQEFTASGTWNKPTGPSFVLVEVWGAGAGGGSGRKGAASSTRTGGSGGGAGAYVAAIFAISELPSSVTVTIGAGGQGGASQASAATNGNAGNNGGDTTFGSFIIAKGGAAGGGGTGAQVTGGAGGAAMDVPSLSEAGGTGGGSPITGSATAPTNKRRAGAGGGAGAGASNTNTDIPAAAGGAIANYGATAVGTGSGAGAGTSGATGTAGSAGSSLGMGGGGGGAGVSGTSNAAGGNGGNGGIAGGGGGGGVGTGTGNSGAGGNGGDGFVRVTAW